MIGDVGQRGRNPAHTDVIEHLMVTGEFSGPTQGDTITLPDGSTRSWTIVEPLEDGSIQDEALRGGYAFARVEAEEAGPMILDARGHSMVYVNGVPRAGDPYSNGLMRIPVFLNKGTNEFLFRVGRGKLKANLLAAPKNADGEQQELAFMLNDDTIPDLVVKKPVDALAGIVVANFSEDWTPDVTLLAIGPNGEEQPSYVPPIPPMSIRKIPVRMAAITPEETGPIEFDIFLLDPNKPEPIDKRSLTLNVVDPTATRRATFQSNIDDSIQYYGIQPATTKASNDAVPGIILSLHGAGVNARRQASCYTPKSFAHVITPTNRRPFGFDWEDWGRLDALEALDHAQLTLDTDANKQWLTGHSMGGHGTWQIAALHPDLFSAIAPSAGWVSFNSYVGEKEEPTDEIGEILRRSANQSDTLLLKDNYGQHGIYILHGAKDDNVPVSEAHTMREELSSHPNLIYHEQPDAGHWWGNQCMDWPPLIEFLESNPSANNDIIDFTTVNPGISGRHNWIEITAQIEQRSPSRVVGKRSPEIRTFEIETENVSRLRFFQAPDQGSWTYIIDGQIVEPGNLRMNIESGSPAAFILNDNTWSSVMGFHPRQKSVMRHGMFKDAFRNNMIFIVGTTGTEEETRANTAKALFDAETFLYRGNGSPTVLRDIDFEPRQFPSLNLILYGNADNNGLWDTLLARSPIVVNRQGVFIDGIPVEGEDLAAIFIRPNRIRKLPSVGVVAGTSPLAMRLTEQLPYFVSGIHYPDFTVFSPDMLLEGETGIRAAGFFGTDWSVKDGEFVLRDTGTQTP